MRKALLFFLALVLMCSCEPVKTLPKDEFLIGKTDTLRIRDIRYQYGYETWHVKRFKFYKHDYLRLSTSYTDAPYLINDPDCRECKRVRDSIVNSMTYTIISAIDSATVTNQSNTEMLRRNISTAIRKLNKIEKNLVDYE